MKNTKEEEEEELNYTTLNYNKGKKNLKTNLKTLPKLLLLML